MRFEVDAVLCDIDGTLVDSTGAVVRTWRAWAARYDVDIEALLAVCHGRRDVDTIADFLPEPQRADAVAVHEALELGDLEDVVALPGAGLLLAALPPTRWAAVTSGPRRLMEARLLAAGLPVPDVMVTAGDVGRGKPDPEGYLLAARLLEVDPGRTLVIEDAPAGIDAGRAAGAAVLAVATSHPVDELSSAHHAVRDLRACQAGPLPDGVWLTAQDERRA